MKELVKSFNLVSTINGLIENGMIIKVYGLLYPPHQENIVYTNEKVNRRGFICTESGLTLDSVAIATKLKTHTVTGWSKIFNYMGNGEYELNVVNGSWIELKLVDNLTQICPGMILTQVKDSGIEIIGFITEIEPISLVGSDQIESIKSEVFKLKVCKENLIDPKEYIFDTSEEDFSEKFKDFRVYDKIIL